ncbi:hypothetical protein ANN_16821 [Periplaneta americana]|uniref:Uncharacterized protein n=1 Tax=Periplaneta americana TaxID=6978 RepID=A0ABQ8SR64_PERAM|nr:hypothetical protein ANN_16821 [Periplaneta americana]
MLCALSSMTRFLTVELEEMGGGGPNLQSSRLSHTGDAFVRLWQEIEYRLDIALVANGALKLIVFLFCEGYIQCCVGVGLCVMYSNRELAEIHFMYGKADGSAALARRLYQERYPQCPDYLWGRLKSLVYSSPVPDLKSLRNRIVACSEDIRNTPGVWDRVRRLLPSDSPETLGHVLGQCPKGELLINARHHRVRHALAISLKTLNWEIHEEVHCVSSDGSFRRADIIAVNGRLKRALVLDPTIRFERNLNQATEVDIEKKKLHLRPEPRNIDELKVIADRYIERLEGGHSPTKRKRKYIDMDRRISRIVEEYPRYKEKAQSTGT